MYNYFFQCKAPLLENRQDPSLSHVIFNSQLRHMSSRVQVSIRFVPVASRSVCGTGSASEKGAESSDEGPGKD